ncbi:hypothetical protein C1H46_026021 [Malus baccata]|uniref:Uncharacterized protein n=1 Tax=Malus baccata TaxID=106549 RepID=A0A540LPN3_MALBA|nr:hypothetical protein C1H46_026021 [Malus baccata]
MRDCAFARWVWMASPIGFPPCPHRSSSSMDWIASWVAVLNPENFAICLMILWAIWGARNNRLWNMEWRPQIFSRPDASLGGRLSFELLSQL